MRTNQKGPGQVQLSTCTPKKWGYPKMWGQMQTSLGYPHLVTVPGQMQRKYVSGDQSSHTIVWFRTTSNLPNYCQMLIMDQDSISPMAGHDVTERLIMSNFDSGDSTSHTFISIRSC